MEGRLVRFGLAASVAVLIVAVAPAAGSRTGPSGARRARGGELDYQVTVRFGPSTLTTTSTANGMVEQLHTGKVLNGGMVVDYSAGTVTMYDLKRKLVEHMSLDSALTVMEKRQTLSGVRYADLHKTPLPFARGTMAPLGQTATIGGVPAEAWRLTTGKTVYRLWYASGNSPLPEPYHSELAKQMPAGGDPVAGEVVLRGEISNGKQFIEAKIPPTVKLLDPATAKGLFVVPSGLHAGSLTLTPPKRVKSSARKSQSVPAHAIRVPVNFLQIHGVNPLVGYWGSLSSAGNAPLRLALNTRIANTYIKLPYISGLLQYGVLPGAMGQASITEGAVPFNDIGNGLNSISSVLHTLTMASVQLDRFGDPAWTVFNQGSVPVVAMAVSDDQVAVGVVDGFHVAVPTRGFIGVFTALGTAIGIVTAGPFTLVSAFNPFAPMIIAPAVPVVVAKVPQPDSGVTNPLSNRADRTGPTMTHEFNETSTDPWGPEIGWADPSKRPFLSANEIGDICSLAFPSINPWTDKTRVNGVLVSTYWSNSGHACVPESRPILTITSPTNGEHFGPGMTIPINAHCVDRVSGNDLPIVWTFQYLSGPGAGITHGLLITSGHAPHPPSDGERIFASCASPLSTGSISNTGSAGITVFGS